MHSRSIGSFTSVLLALIASSASALSVQVELNFVGTNINQSGFIPPDTMGAVGTNHIVELLNGSYAVYDKTNGTKLLSSSLNQFWQNAGVTPAGSFAFDPRLLFDPSTDRWFAASTDNAGGLNNILVAVSNGSDPTQGWTGFKIDGDSSDQAWADFPTLGIDDDGIYVAANMFDIVTDLNVGSSVLVLPKADLVAATPTVANHTYFENLTFQAVGFTLQPVVNLDPSGIPAPLLSDFLSFPIGAYKRTDITGSVTAPSLDTTGAWITDTTFVLPPNPAAQPGPKQNIDTGDNRFSGSVVLQNGAMWAVQTVENAGLAAIHWIQIDATTNIVLQSGTIADPNLDLYYPSISVNNLDQVVIGFSGSSETQFASAYAAVGETQAGVTTFGNLLLLRAGLADYQVTFGGLRNRWGDYSATVLDPTDPGLFWTFQEFVLAPDVWAINVTSLRVTPEPATVLLLACGLAALARRTTRLMRH